MDELQQLVEVLRCPRCQGSLSPSNGAAEGALSCPTCNEQFPIVDGIPRLLLSPLREALLGNGKASGVDAVQVETALSFGFEWTRFPEMYREWRTSFLNYMQPHPPEYFHGKRALDAGCGTGRFAYYAAEYGADVWAIDLGPAVKVARRNTAKLGKVNVVQADLYQPPFALGSFDFVYSIGVLHHLPDPEAAFRNLLRFLKPGGQVQIYLYWKHEGQPLKQALLALVTAARQVTTRLPHSVVHFLAFPAAVLAFALFVWPYQILKRIPGLKRLAEKIPMKQYANFPFRVCVNDQLDRLSAPIENRYRKAEVEEWLKRAGLEDGQVYPNVGWVATGRKPLD
jgi:ubiquinone/menaquinone biosynthesis C-methylase UbiE/uncharacterized protein YbaR (Trm112 family)